jgi:hypothetical protein
MKGQRHQLLIYQRVHRQRRFAFLVAALGFAVLYIVIEWPLLDQAALVSLYSVWSRDLNILLIIGSALFFLGFLFKLVAPRLAYVQCTDRNIRIQTPLYPIVISYRRVVTVRPNQWGSIYPPEKRTRSQRRLLDQAWGAGVLILDLKGWPMSRGFLKLWIPDVMFLPGGDGLVMWVTDWMGLNRELTDFKDRWREAHSGSKPEVSVYSRLKK